MSDIILNTELRLDESKLRQSINRIEQQLKFRGPFANMATDVSRFDHELTRATQRVITLGTAFQLLGSAARTIREIAASTVQVEKALTDINSVFRLTNENLSKFSGTLFNIARETAKSFDEVAKAAVEFSRQGLSVQKTQEAVRASLILSRDANIDVAVSVRALTAAVNSFQKEGITYTQVINRLAAADSAFAVSSKDLQEALIRVGSAASDVGVNFNELIALVTSAQQITARGGSVIAGALNTIFTRINRRDTLDALEALGVAISDTQGRMLPTLNVLQNFAKAYDKMTGSVKNQAAELVGGVRQLNTLKAVLDDLGRSNSVFAQSLREVENAQDAAERRNAARNQSLSARLAQLQETGRQIGSNIGSIGFESQAKGALNFITNNPVTEALRNAGDLTNESFGAEVGRIFIKGFGNAVIFGIGPILAAVGYRVSKRVFSNLTEDIKDLTMMNGAAKEQAAIQKQVIALYQAGGSALQQQLAAMTSLNQQAAVFARLMGSAAPPFQAGAVASTLQSFGVRPMRSTPRAAGGYIPFGEESAAISRGVGGAPSSARPVYLPNFNRGGGQKGIVANTSEFIVPHLAGGSAIYNREMIQKYGLPPGATPVAAEGYIPTASAGFNPYGIGQQVTANILGQIGGNATLLGQNPAIMQMIAAAVNDAIKAHLRQFSNPQLGGISPFPTGTRATKMDILAGSLSGSPTDYSYIKTLVGAGRSGTLESVFEQQVKKLIDRGKSLENAYALASRTYMASGGSAQQLASTQAKLLQSLVSYTTEVKESQRAQVASRIAIEKQVIFNNAASQINAGQSFTALSRSERNAYVSALQRQAASVLGFNNFDEAMSVSSSRAQINAMVAPKIAELSRRGRPSNLINMIGSRLSSPLGSAGAMGLAMGLPFIGANIDPGAGGTSGGMWRGAASTGLSMAGFGASVGMMTGNPFGPLVGAGIGAMFGGLIGAIQKSTKSFEELTMELDQSKKKLVENYEKASQFLRLQEELEAAKAAGREATVLDLSRQQVQLLASVSPEVRADMLSLRKDPNRLAKMAERASRKLTTEGMRADFLSSIKKIESGDFESKEGESIIGSGLTAAMSVMMPETLKEMEKKMKAGDAMGVLNMLASTVGVDPSVLKNIELERFAGQIGGDVLGATGGMVPTKTGRQVGAALASAFGNVKIITDPRNSGALGPAGLSSQEMARLSSLYRMGSAFSGIENNAALQLMQAQQQQILSAPTTERNRLFRAGQLELQSVSEKARLGRAGALAEGRSSLVDALIAGGVRSPEAFAEVGGLTGRDAIMDLLFRVQTDKAGGAFSTTQKESIEKSLMVLLEKYQVINKEEEEGLKLTKEINAIKQQMFEDERDYSKIATRLFAASKDEAEKAIATSRAVAGLINTPGISGSTIESGLMGGATTIGSYGNARGSFMGGFQSRFAGLKRDVFQFAEIGSRVAQSLESNLGNAFGDFVTGANTAKNAFRSFAISVLSDASRMFASKALQSFISFIPGFTPAGATGGEFTGSAFRFAGGGAVPALLTGGEFYVSPKAAKRIGYDTLRQLNRYAEGGVVRGGSGVKDDVPARLAPGSFIIRKSATERLGSDYLQSLVDGRVQGRFWGGVLMGGLLGGGLGYAVGGKKGALIGAGIGALGGAAYGMMGSGASMPSSPSLSVGESAVPMGDAAIDMARTTASLSTKVSGAVTGTPWWKPALYGLGAAGVLGLAANALSPKSGPGPISAAQVPAFRAGLEAQQSEMFSKNRYAYLTVNPQGGYSLGSFGPELATRRWSDGGTVSGGVDMAVVPGPHGGGSPVSAPQVSVKIEINNNGQVSSKSGSTSGDDGPFGADFGTRLEKSIRPIVQDELIRQSRNDGFFSQKSRYMNG